MRIPKLTMKRTALNYSELLLRRDIEPHVEEEYPFYHKSQLHHMIRIEQKRTDRSKKPFLLLLLDISAFTAKERHKETLEKIKSVLSSSLREADVKGWFDHNKIIGVIFPEIALINANAIERIIHKIHARFCEKLNPELVKKFSLSFYIYPETNVDGPINYPFKVTFYPDITKLNISKNLTTRH